MAKNQQKIIVAMSGGVDSSVAAALLKKEGFSVLGAYFQLSGINKSAQNRAESAAKVLGIPFFIFDFQKEFQKRVIDYFLKEYKAGKTPNPCMVCNKEIKFRFLLEKALELKADYIATGHYVRNKLKTKNENLKTKTKNLKLFQLSQAKDIKKDQSYFLWRLGQKELQKALFPIGDYTKPEVRVMAQKFGLPTANTKESQEVCFVKTSTGQFLKKYLKTKKGPIIDEKGNLLGQHQGLWFYTQGQRKGIRLPGGPYFVIAKNCQKNTLIVSKDKSKLKQKVVFFKQANWVLCRPLVFPIKAKAKIRSQALLSSCLVYKNKAVFQKPQTAVSPGQSIVWYRGQLLLGGAVIV